MASIATSLRKAWPKGGEPLGPYEEIELHGHTVGFQAAGEGPLLLLLHGITSTSDAWRDVMPELAERYTVVAPDLLGHGRSAKPRGDYSLGAYAAGRARPARACSASSAAPSSATRSAAGSRCSSPTSSPSGSSAWR